MSRGQTVLVTIEVVVVVLFDLRDKLAVRGSLAEPTKGVRPPAIYSSSARVSNRVTSFVLATHPPAEAAAGIRRRCRYWWWWW